MHLTGLCMHALHALSHDVTGRCMQLLPRALLFWFHLGYTFISSYFGFMVHTANLVVNVSYVSGRCKKTLWKASACSRHKTKQVGQQGKQADKAGRLTRQSGLLALFCACLVCFCPTTSAIILLMFYKLICVGQSTSLRYLWLQFLFCYFSSTISPQA